MLRSQEPSTSHFKMLDQQFGGDLDRLDEEDIRHLSVPKPRDVTASLLQTLIDQGRLYLVDKEDGVVCSPSAVICYKNGYLFAQDR